jgi:prophage regulatory protein
MGDRLPVRYAKQRGTEMQILSNFPVAASATSRKSRLKAQASVADHEQFLNRASVEQMTSLGRSTIYKLMAAGTFPEPYKLGSQRVGWKRSDITGWLSARTQVCRRRAA